MTLTDFLFAFLGVLVLFVYDFLHYRAAYIFKNHIFKYLISFLVVGFGFAALTRWKYFQWLEIVAAAILLGIFWDVLVKGILAVIAKFKQPSANAK